MSSYARRVQPVRWRIARRHLNQKRSHRLRWTLAVLMGIAVATAGGTGGAAMYFMAHLPSIDKFQVKYAFQNARIYDSQGHMLFNMADLSQNAGRRVVEPLQGRYDTQPACRGGINRIPVVLQNATIATEDATFYTNPGFDLGSILRAAYQNLQSGRIVSGASTITQQIVRANLLTDARTLDRKAQEIALAYEISKRYSKRQILSFYLNSVPYGEQTVGAAAAAEIYFHQQVCSIDLAQAALLAGLPRAPSDYNPVLHRSAAMSRMREALNLLHQHGYLQSQVQIAAAMGEAARWRFSPPASSMRYPAFVQYAIDQLKRMPHLAPLLYQGIDIYTTIDPRLQDLAQTTVTNQINLLQTTNHVTDGSLVSIDLRPQHYGWVLAMVGSANYRSQTGQINMAIRPRQPGSSMKPFNYIYAFQHGVGPGTYVVDSPIQLPDPSDTQHHGWYVPVDYDHTFHGQVTVRQALANSLNVPAVKIEYYITGSNHVARTAFDFGMKSLYKDNPGIDCSVCYSVTLGGLAHGTRLLEETAAYGVFATGGTTVPPVAIWKVVQRGTRKVLWCSADCPRGVQPQPWLSKERKQVVDPAHAFEMTDVLSDNNARCTPQVCEFGLVNPLVLTHPSAAKTGTTNDWTDNWTVGYTPQIVTGVWTGNADYTPMQNVIGITGAAPIYQSFMEAAFGILKLPAVPFVAPPGVNRGSQCTVTSTGVSTSTGLASATPTPISSVSGYGVNDLYVGSPPMCRIPEKGPMPVPCTQYPQPLPVGWECLYQTGYGYYYTIVNGVKIYQQYPVATAVP
jgi:membrane peptidoglycan carboxypeptidase